jgi:hypothetical protein
MLPRWLGLCWSGHGGGLTEHLCYECHEREEGEELLDNMIISLSLIPGCKKRIRPLSSVTDQAFGRITAAYAPPGHDEIDSARKR